MRQTEVFTISMSRAWEVAREWKIQLNHFLDRSSNRDVVITHIDSNIIYDKGMERFDATYTVVYKIKKV